MVQDLITRQIDPDELASLVRRGDDFVNFRDLSSARLLYRRAAEAGNVRAALALAGTFDPNVLKKLGFPENVGEVTKARLWYERAQQLGSAEAPQRLEQLATVTNSGN
jgi:TPR repeat protein